MARSAKKHQETRLARLRSKLFSRQNGHCYYCRTPMLLRKFAIQDELNDRDATIEHLVPRILGGRDTPDNLVAACHFCNRVGARIDKWCVDTFGGRRLSRRELSRLAAKSRPRRKQQTAN